MRRTSNSGQERAAGGQGRAVGGQERAAGGNRTESVNRPRPPSGNPGQDTQVWTTELEEEKNTGPWVKQGNRRQVGEENHQPQVRTGGEASLRAALVSRVVARHVVWPVILTDDR